MAARRFGGERANSRNLSANDASGRGAEGGEVALLLAARGLYVVVKTLLLLLLLLLLLKALVELVFALVLCRIRDDGLLTDGKWVRFWSLLLVSHTLAPLTIYFYGLNYKKRMC